MAEPAQLPQREPAHEEPTQGRAERTAEREPQEHRYPAIEAAPSAASRTLPPRPAAPAPAGPDQARIDNLLDAANTASAHARNVYLTFLLFGLYLAIIFGSTTHEQLLRESPVTLPIFDVGLPLVGFYWIAPAFFVLLHLNLLLQLYLLSGKLHRLDHALDDAVTREHLHADRADEERARLYPYPFSQMLIGRQHGRLMRFLLWLVVWLTVLVLPVVLLPAGQVRFLPYHDVATTMWHRGLVAVDLLLLLIFWRPIRHPEDRCSHIPGGGSGTRPRRCRAPSPRSPFRGWSSRFRAKRMNAATRWKSGSWRSPRRAWLHPAGHLRSQRPLNPTGRRDRCCGRRATSLNGSGFSIAISLCPRPTWSEAGRHGSRSSSTAKISLGKTSGHPPIFAGATFAISISPIRSSCVVTSVAPTWREQFSRVSTSWMRSS